MASKNVATLVLVAVGALLGAAYCLDKFSDVDIKGRPLVKSGMTRNEVVGILGAPRRQQVTNMTPTFYGVPDEIRAKIGVGNPFEMLQYEESIPRKSVSLSVFLCPDPNESGEMKVIDTASTCVCQSLWYRFLHRLPLRQMGLDD